MTALSACNSEGEVDEQASLSVLPVRPVMIGRDGPESDACGSLGMVAELSADENSLSIHNAPDLEAEVTGKLKPGHDLWICDQDDSGDWMGVVYYNLLEPQEDCGVASPVPSVQTYAGACKQGWVEARRIALVAG